MATDNKDKDKISGVTGINSSSAAKQVAEVNRLENIEKVKNVQTVDKVKSVQATAAVGALKAAGKIDFSRSIANATEEQRQVMLQMVEEEAEKLFGKSGDMQATAIRKAVTEAVKMVITGAGEG